MFLNYISISKYYIYLYVIVKYNINQKFIKLYFVCKLTSKISINKSGKTNAFSLAHHPS